LNPKLNIFDKEMIFYEAPLCIRNWKGGIFVLDADGQKVFRLLPV